MTPKPSTAVEIAVIPDRIERVRAAVRFLAEERLAIGQVMEIRDQTILLLCKEDGMSRTRVSVRTGASLPVVIDALRARQ